MIRSDPHSGQYRKRGRLAFKKYDAGKIGEYRFSDNQPQGLLYRGGST